MAVGHGISEVAALGAAGDEHQLDAEGIENMAGALFHAQAKQELHFFVADLYHVGLGESPDQLLLGLLQVAPEGLAEVGVVADELAPLFGVGHSLIGSGAGGFVGQGKRAEVEHLGRVDQREIQLSKGQAGIGAGLAGKGEGAVAVFVKGDKGQGGEHVVGGDDAAGVDAALFQGMRQHLAESVGTDFSQQGGFGAELGQSGQEVSRRAAGMGCHGGIAVAVRLQAGKINEQFAQSHDIQFRVIHCAFPHFAAGYSLQSSR